MSLLILHQMEMHILAHLLFSVWTEIYFWGRGGLEVERLLHKLHDTTSVGSSLAQRQIYQITYNLYHVFSALRVVSNMQR